jgi:hypothetical protein
MSKNHPKGQHFVPNNSYLSEFTNPNTPVNFEPYVWVFKKGSRIGIKRAPSNILKETELYTLHLRTGEKNYTIEETLSKIENEFAKIFRKKIKNHKPLSEEEHIYLCAFVSTMLQRTLRHRDNLLNFIDQLIEHSESAELQYAIEPKESTSLKEYKKNMFQNGIVQTLPDTTKLLLNMGLAFLCAEGNAKFITSDDPCNLFNPDLQWQKFYSPGLAQKNTQITLPLSPEIMLCMSWSNLRGYIKWKNKDVHESNRLIAGHCYKEFISSSSYVKKLWLRSYPNDAFFVLKILSHKFNLYIKKIKIWLKYKHYVSK